MVTYTAGWGGSHFLKRGHSRVELLYSAGFHVRNNGWHFQGPVLQLITKFMHVRHHVVSHERHFHAHCSNESLIAS